METIINIAIIISIGLGATLSLVGWLFSVVTALGNKQYMFGIASIVLPPVSLAYCALNYKKSKYSANLLFLGVSLVIATTCITFFYYG